MTAINVTVNRPQGAFLSMAKKYRAFVGGFGSGKTWTSSLGVCCHVWEFPLAPVGYFAPNYPLIRDVFFPKIEEVAALLSLKTVIRETNKEVHFYNGRQYRGTCLCRSMERPDTIVGFDIAKAFVDELDILPADKAETAWHKIDARLRYGKQPVSNGIDVTTTPEGYKFVYRRFVEKRTESYGIVQASTYDNKKNLPPNYIASLLETYPKALVDAYIEGRFVNLTSGRVYYSYDRARCDSKETILPGDELHIGQDFNVGNMRGVVFVKRPDGVHAAAELSGVYDTPALIKAVQSRYAGHKAIFYPDASASARNTTNASVSDISLLKQAGYAVRVNPSNPAVRDRVLAVNAALEKGTLRINAAACRDVADCLEKQAYDKNGEPDKTAGYDHSNDALGYFVAHALPVKKPLIAVMR